MAAWYLRSRPPHSMLSAIAEQLSPHRLSRGLAPVVHLSTRPILGQVSRSHGAARGTWEEPQAELREGGLAWLRKKFASVLSVQVGMSATATSLAFAKSK